VSLFGAEKVSILNRFWREMAPIPGRMETTLRFALASALATLLLLILQAPLIFYAPSLFMLFLVSHDTPFHCFQGLATCVSFATLGTASALLLVIATGNEPVARVVGLGVFTFLATFLFRACTMPLAPLSFGCLAYMTLSLWENHLRAEKILHLSLWPMGTLATVAASGVVVDYLFNRSDPLLALRREIKARCAALEQLFQLCATRADSNRIDNQCAIVRRYAVTGEGQLHILLERISKRETCSHAEFRHLKAMTLVLDRVLTLGASFAVSNKFEVVNPARLQRISEAIAAAGEKHLEKVNDILGDTPGGAVAVAGVETPLPGELDQIERTLRHLGDSAQSSVAEPATEGPEAPSGSANSFFKNLFLPDAFTNYDYFMYALKLSVCATICFVLYNALKWPGIGTAIYFTVYFTGLSTTGASNRKLLFRVIGSAIGGMILGIGCLVFVFPNIEGVPGFLLVLAALSALGAWVAASPYFGYIGLQITYAFNLLAFERFGAPDQMTPARDRLLGIALGFLVLFVIFHQVRPERTVDTMRRLLARLLRAQAEVISLLDMEPNAATDARMAAIKKQIAADVANLQSFADVVTYEFPPDRATDVRLSNELVNAVTSAADLLICVRAWPQELDGNQRSECLKKIRNTLEDGLRNLACSLEQFLEVQPEAPQKLETAFENCRNMAPVCVSKAIDTYRELQMACTGIVRLAA